MKTKESVYEGAVSGEVTILPPHIVVSTLPGGDIEYRRCIGTPRERIIRATPVNEPHISWQTQEEHWGDGSAQMTHFRTITLTVQHGRQLYRITSNKPARYTR